MAGCKSTPEIEQQHLEAFGDLLGPIYHALYNEVLWLHMKWLEYRKLYAESVKRVELLNSTAPFFFHVIQEVVWENVLLHIARLTDPAIDKRGNRNRSLFQLPKIVAEPGLAEEIGVLVREAAAALAGFARTWRHKRLAHCDLAHELGQAARLPAVSRQDVEAVLGSVRAVMNRLQSAYLNSTTAYVHASAGAGDAEALVCWLAEARQVEDGRQQRAREGKSRPEDFQSPMVP
jgi:hypothetical protein